MAVIACAMIVVVRVFMVAMIMRVMIMPAVMRVATAGISAAFGIERRFDLNHARAEATHHVFDDMIAANTKSLADDLSRKMSVSEMPRNAHEMMRIGTANFDQRLGRGNNLDKPPVFKDERVSPAQRNRLLQIEKKFQPSRSRHRHAATMTIVEIEHNRIGCRRLNPAILPVNFRGADQRTSTFSGVMISILVGALMHSFTTARHGFM